MNLTEISSALSESMRPYSAEIANSIVITLLAIYGNDLNRMVKNKAKNLNVVLRSLVFILFVTFGYGFLTVLLLPHIGTALHHFGNKFLAPVTIGFYIFICLLAARKKQV